MKCFDCVNKRRVTGSAHILCYNPPEIRLTVGAGGKERYAIAAELAEKHDAVVQCIWPGSGFFPGGIFAGFDGNTVFGCSHFEAVEKTMP